MNIDTIPVISVSYNSAELIDELLSSFRQFYRNPVTIIDGSDEQHYRAIEAVCARYAEVRFIHFDYNIHHGPGMAWAFQNLELQGKVLVLDSDVVLVAPGLIEAMAAELEAGMYGVGYVNHVNEGGFDVDYEAGAIRYLHPACMMVNIEVLRQWPMPTRHGAPMTVPMLALHRAGQDSLIRGIEAIRQDFSSEYPDKHYLRHDWQGTVKRTGGYHLEEWQEQSRAAAEVRLAALAMLPADARRLLEIGANDGALARTVKEARPDCHYTALETDPARHNVSRGASDVVLQQPIDSLDDAFFRDHADTDCWILDQALERAADPALLLGRIRKCIGPTGSVVAVVPNAQHWGMQLRLAMGDLAYGETGLLSPGQRRWFSRTSMFALFQQAGFEIVGGLPVTSKRLANPPLEAAMRQLAACMGADPDMTFADAQPDLYVVQARPR